MNLKFGIIQNCFRVDSPVDSTELTYVSTTQSQAFHNGDIFHKQCESVKPTTVRVPSAGVPSKIKEFGDSGSPPPPDQNITDNQRQQQTTIQDSNRQLQTTADSSRKQQAAA
jgi:hypothetical protein